MTFELEFDPRAWREWKKLGDTVRQQFKKKLVEVLERPRNEANRLHGLPDCYLGFCTKGLPASFGVDEQPPKVAATSNARVVVVAFIIFFMVFPLVMAFFLYQLARYCSHSRTRAASWSSDQSGLLRINSI